MAMPKLAYDVAQATGATVRNPERYQDAEALPTDPLGPPSPEIVAEGLMGEWSFITKSIGWLTEADRRLVELACIYRANNWRRARHRLPMIDDDLIVPARLERVEDLLLIFVDDKAVNVELRILEKLGATPASRPKVVPPGHKGGKIKRKKDGWW